MSPDQIPAPIVEATARALEGLTETTEGGEGA